MKLTSSHGGLPPLEEMKLGYGHKLVDGQVSNVASIIGSHILEEVLIW